MSSESPIQSAVFAEGGLYGPRPTTENFRWQVNLSKGRPGAAEATAHDPRATCPGA